MGSRAGSCGSQVPTGLSTAKSDDWLKAIEGCKGFGSALCRETVVALSLDSSVQTAPTVLLSSLLACVCSTYYLYITSLLLDKTEHAAWALLTSYIKGYTLASLGWSFWRCPHCAHWVCGLGPVASWFDTGWLGCPIQRIGQLMYGPWVKWGISVTVCPCIIPSSLLLCMFSISVGPEELLLITAITGELIHIIFFHCDPAEVWPICHLYSFLAIVDSLHTFL